MSAPRATVRGFGGRGDESAPSEPGRGNDLALGLEDCEEATRATAGSAVVLGPGRFESTWGSTGDECEFLAFVGLDATVVGRGEVRGEHESVLFLCAPENRATRRDGLGQIVTSGEMQLGPEDLDRMMNHVADEVRSRSFTREVEHRMTDRVAHRGFDGHARRRARTAATRSSPDRPRPPGARSHRTRTR